jgi:hypothetical protein
MIIDNENEERLFSNKPEIENIIKYIKSVNLYIKDIDKKNIAEKSLKRVCERNNIPFFVWNDFKSFKLLNRKKTIELEAEEEIAPKPSDRKMNDTLGEKVSILLNKMFSRRIQEVELNYLKSITKKDLKSCLRAMVDKYSSLHRKNFESVVSYLRKYNLQFNIDGLYDFIKEVKFEKSTLILPQKRKTNAAIGKEIALQGKEDVEEL